MLFHNKDDIEFVTEFFALTIQERFFFNPVPRSLIYDRSNILDY